MSIPHQLRCLGYPTLHAPDGSAVRFRVKKHLALLVYLAMAPRIHRRDRLAELLWPAVSEREGRHSLATGLSVLRAKLGHPAIEAGRDTVRLVGGSLELDLDRLAAGDILGSETVPVLAVAPLLEDFDIPDAPGWNQWKDAEAANWQPRIRDALLTLTDRSRRHGDTRAMERLADSLLAIDPLSEEGIRSKMEARAFAGDRLSALKHFETWKARLADEVGAQPGELVEGMAVRLRRRGWERTSESHIAPVHTDQWKDRPFIGRGAQYRVLYEAWESTGRGAPRHVLITGDSGVGKSTLAERLATAAGLQGAVSAREQCHEVARDVPYAAIGGLAVGLLDKPGASTIAPEWLGELGRAVSEVRRRFPHAPPPLDAEGETVRIRIADAFVELVNAVAEEQPVILILDDLHLADDASVSVLHLLLRRLERQRVQVLLTARPGEISNGGNAQRLVERADQVGLSGVSVPPLSPEEASELLDSLVATRGEAGPTPAARRALLQAAAGYPMVLELLTDDWHTHGERCLALSLGGMTEQAATEGPGAMYARILERLAAELDPTSHNVLNLAAVLGARLNDFALYGLADLTLAQTMAGLSRLAAVRILRDAGEGLEFINELMRAQAYVAVPSSVRRVLHSKVADQLIERADGGEPMLGLEIAWHCIRARRKDEFARYLISGSDDAIEQGAHVNAERALLTAIPNLEPGVKEQAQFRLALVLQDQGRWTDSKLLFAVGAEDSGRDEMSPDARAAITIANAMLDSRSSIPRDSSLNALTSVIEGDASLRTKLRAAAAAASYGVRTYHPKLLHFVAPALDRLSAATTRGYDQAAIAVTRAQIYWPYRRFDECMAFLDHAEDLASPLPEYSPTAMRICLGRGSTYSATAKYEQALVHLARASRIANHIGNDTQAAAAMLMMAQCQVRLGCYNDTLESIRQFEKIRTPEIASPHPLTALYYAAFAHTQLRHATDAAAIIRQGDAVARDFVGSWIGDAWHLWSAEVQWMLGDDRDAMKRAKTGIDLLRHGLSNVGLAGAYCRWCAVLFDRGVPVHDTEGAFALQIADIERRDTFDQVEIALAAMAPYGHSTLSPQAIEFAAKHMVAKLPIAARMHIRQLGLPCSLDDSPTRENEIPINLSNYHLPT